MKDHKNWYNESGMYMQELDEKLRVRPRSGAVNENLDPDFDQEDFNGLDNYDDPRFVREY